MKYEWNELSTVPVFTQEAGERVCQMGGERRDWLLESVEAGVD